MNWKSFVADKSLKAFKELLEMYPSGLENFQLDERDSVEYGKLRDELIECDKVASALMQESSRGKYLYDLEFGLRMYDVLLKQGIELWQAADIGFWAYLSIKVIPDIVYRRWGGYNDDRFYKRSGRVWLKSLWWYVYLTEDGLSEQFDIDQTRNLLKDGSEDIIYLLLDHSRNGYRDEVYHALFNKYVQFCTGENLCFKKEDFLRAVFKQHEIKSVVMDPLLGSVDSYVDSLFDMVAPKFVKEA